MSQTRQLYKTHCRKQPIHVHYDEKWTERLTENEGESILTEGVLFRVSEHIGEGWEAVGVRLGLSYVSVERFRMSHSGPQMQVFSMLNKWRQGKGSKVTVGELISTLQDCVQVCTIDMVEVIKTVQGK